MSKQAAVTKPLTVEDLSIECKQVILHTAVTIPGWFTESTLHRDGVKHKGLRIYWQPDGRIDGLVLRYKGGTRILPKSAVQQLEPLLEI
jgi:hypothetical protein